MVSVNIENIKGVAAIVIRIGSITADAVRMGVVFGGALDVAVPAEANISCFLAFFVEVALDTSFAFVLTVHGVDPITEDSAGLRNMGWLQDGIATGDLVRADWQIACPF